MQSQLIPFQKMNHSSDFSRATILFCSIFILCFICLDCSRFRVQRLKALPLFSLDLMPIDSKNPDMKLQPLQREGSVYNLPVRPAIARGKVYLSDANHKVVRVFNDSQDKALLLLAAHRPSSLSPGSSVVYKQVNLGIPGWIAVDEDTEDIYIQSYSSLPPDEKKPLPPEKRLSGRHSRIFQSPSVILKLDKKGNLIARIGKEGYNSSPFDLIVQMYSDLKERLYVLHKDRETNELELLVFEKGRLLKRFAMPELDMDLGSKNNLIILEHIQAVASQNFVIGSIVVRKKDDFDLIERIIYQQSHPQAKARVLLRNDNLIDFLIWADPKGSFYMLQTEDSGLEILIKIFSNRGKYLGNRSIELPGLRSSWRDIFFNLEGRIFSSRLLQSKFLLYEWK